jgi:nicotinamidase-related amidase
MADFSLAPKKTALVIIDLQQGIVASSIAPHKASDIVANTVRVGQALKAAGGLVVAVHVAFSADGGDRLKQPTDQVMQVPPGGFPANWSEIVPEVLALEPGLTITKRQWSAFHGTELDLQLRRRGIDTIVFTGISTNFGVEGSGRDAWQHGYFAVFAEDAMSGPTPEHHAFATQKIFPRLGRVRSTAEVVAALG